MSVTCGLCLKQVEHLKTNSHIQPRWMLTHIKTDGKLSLISETEVRPRHQTDRKADIVCNECEEAFTVDDTWSVKFFRDREYFKEIRIAEERGERILMEIHDKACKELLLKFLCSMILREHLRLKHKSSTGLLGKYFEPLAGQYLSGKMSILCFPYHAYYYEVLPSGISLPGRQMSYGRNAISMMIFGYQFSIYFTNRRPKDDIFAEITIGDNDLHVPIFHGDNNAFMKDLRAKASKIIRRKK